MKHWAVVIAVLLAACGGGTSSHTIHGTITVPAYETQLGDNRCLPDDGYDDIDRGASVKIEDDSGKIIGTSAVADLGKQRDGRCVFSFTATGVKDADFYTVKASHRDGPAFKRAELEKDHWRMALTLG